MLAVRTAQRVSGLSPAEDALAEISVPREPINTVLSAALRVEAAALRAVDLPFGSSLLCLARKPV
jgi:hypothetical protein